MLQVLAEHTFSKKLQHNQVRKQLSVHICMFLSAFWSLLPIKTSHLEVYPFLMHKIMLKYNKEFHLYLSLALIVAHVAYNINLKLPYCQNKRVWFKSEVKALADALILFYFPSFKSYGLGLGTYIFVFCMFMSSV